MLGVRIAGAGVAGLTLALALRQAGIANVELYSTSQQRDAEQYPEQGPEQGPEQDPGLILPPNATRILSALGLGHALSTNSIEPTLMAERAWRSGYLLTQRPLGEFAQQRYGAPHVVIAEPTLEHILRERLHGYGLPVLTTPIPSGGGTHILVGCDGPESRVRRSMGYPSATGAADYAIWRARISTADAPAGLGAKTITTWLGPQQIFRHWPGCKPETIELQAICPVTVADIHVAFRDWNPILRTAIQRSREHRIQALAASPPISDWYRNNQVLLGAACHPLHPYLQQDTALAMEDAWVLARMLDRWEEETATALRDYERYRKVRIQRVRAATKSHWEQAILPPGAKAQTRNLKISLLNRFLPEMAMQQLDWLYGYDCVAGFD